MRRQQCQDYVGRLEAFFDRGLPVLPALDVHLVKPDLVAAGLQDPLELARELRMLVVAVADEDS